MPLIVGTHRHNKGFQVKIIIPQKNISTGTFINAVASIFVTRVHRSASEDKDQPASDPFLITEYGNVYYSVNFNLL